jgi:hypothetical protein
MKVECPVCGKVGILETRGNSQRVVHYRYDESGKRIFTKHRIDKNLGTMGTALGTENINLVDNGQKLVNLVRSPGFEPEYPAWEAGVLTRLDYDRLQSL